MKPQKLVDADDTLSANETALVRKADRETREGKYVTLAQLRDDLERPGTAD